MTLVQDSMGLSHAVKAANLCDSEKGNIGTDRSLVILKLPSKPSCQQVLFNANADFSSNHEEQQTDQEQLPRGDDHRGCAEYKKHRRVDRISHKAIRSRLDQMMFRAQYRVHAHVSG